ncbi:MAG: hypothetical protein Q7T26_07375 [Dehalococcoidia bacterium]|nr:hypothetical protein [Dehalococcoidia bacterium]
MTTQRFKQYLHRTWLPGEFSGGLRSLINAFADKSKSVSIKWDRRLSGGFSEQKEVSISDIGSVETLKNGSSIAVHFTTLNGEGVYMSLQDWGDSILAIYSGDSAETLLSLCTQAEKELGFTEYVASENVREPPASDTNSRGTSRLRCFLSYRFYIRSEQASVQIQKFLALLGVEVVTGTGYEPRSISDKVKERLSKEKPDFLVYLLTADGESAWIRDEMAGAKALGVPIVPVVEENTTLQTGILGDSEYITFTQGHIGDSFLKLLEAVNYVRRTRNYPKDSASNTSEEGAK